MPGDTQLVVCEIARGEKIRFPDENRPISVISFDGFGSMDFDVKTSQNSGQDGENYNTSQAKKRNLTITFDIQSDYQRQRDHLHSFFQPRSWGTVYYYETEGGEGRKARYQVESLQIADYGVSRAGTLSLICPDPKFYALTDNLTELAVWEGMITFPLRLPPQINAEGQNVTLTVDDSIEDYDKIAITGQTVQDGTGDPSPDNVRPIRGVTSLTISDGGSNLQTVALPQTLYSLPDGTVDEYDAVKGTGTQRIKLYDFDGSENWKVGSLYMVDKNTGERNCEFQLNVPLQKDHVGLCTHLVYGANLGNTEKVVVSKTILYFQIHASRLSDASLEAFKVWLAANPVTVLYELASPQAITGTPQTIPIYHPTTTLSLDAGTLALRCRGKFVVTEKINTLIGNVVNPSAVPMGLTVTFRASGTVVNPSLYDVNRQLLMQVNTTMRAGDQIVITTADGNKRVKLISGGVESNINNLMAYPPHWLQAQQGDNLYRYNADSGIDSLSVSILSTQAYWGA